MQKIHEGICGSHIGGRSLAMKVLRAGFLWPTLRGDCAEYVKKCDRCQRHSNEIKIPVERLYSLITPWSFFRWGIDILGPFPISVRQFKFIVVAVEYFTKWIEVEALTTIISDKITKFVWRSIICRFGIPKELISDNGTRFAS